MPRRRVTLRDCTLREGLDVPGVSFSPRDALRLARALARLGVRELELGAPGSPAAARAVHDRIKREALPLVTSGVVLALGDPREKLRQAASLDRVDVLMPMAGRGPTRLADKIAALREALGAARALGIRDAGAGFPHATSCDARELRSIALAAKAAGAQRLILYDTNGVASPSGLAALVAALRGALPVHVHCHNDLGLAVANSLAAVEAGADAVDCTLNGLGDRAGNCALEPLALNLRLNGYADGLSLERLQRTSDLAARLTGLRPKLFPVTGEYAFYHATKTHLAKPELFEPFPPTQVGARRRVIASGDARPAERQLACLLRGRRSVRDFLPKPVPRAVLRRVLRDSMLAPSSMDGRPWHFVVIEDRDVLEQLVRVKDFYQPAAKKRYPMSFMLGAPCAVALCVDAARSHDRETENAALAAGWLMLSAHAAGLGTTYLTAHRPGQPGLERAIRKVLGLPRNITPRCILPLGYPAESPKPRTPPALSGRWHEDRWRRGPSR